MHFACRFPLVKIRIKPLVTPFLKIVPTNGIITFCVTFHIYSVGIQCQRAVREGKYTSGIIVAQSGEDPRS